MHRIKQKEAKARPESAGQGRARQGRAGQGRWAAEGGNGMGSDECVPPPVQIPDLRSLCLSPSRSLHLSFSSLTRPPSPYHASRQKTTTSCLRELPEGRPGARSRHRFGSVDAASSYWYTARRRRPHVPTAAAQRTSHLTQVAAEKPARATDASWRRICRPRLIREPARRINALFG